MSVLYIATKVLFSHTKYTLKINGLHLFAEFENRNFLAVAYTCLESENLIVSDINTLTFYV